MKLQTKEQGWVKLSSHNYPKWITRMFPRRESERCYFKGETFVYKIETKIMSGHYGAQGHHNGIETIHKMWRMVK